MNRRQGLPGRGILPSIILGLLQGMLTPAQCPAGGYDIAFSTYLGGSGRADSSRAVAVDGHGNIYVSGGTQSPDFIATPGAYDTTYATGGGSVGSSGPMDVFVTKFDPAGQVVWSTFLGGPNYDRAYSIAVDAQGDVYVAGRAGENFPTTTGTVQPNFAGDVSPNGAYGKQDGFISKLSADGSQLLWSTYFGTPGPAIIRDMDLDTTGNIYVSMIELSYDSPHITTGALQTTRPGGRDSLVAKISPDASRTVWASYLGGSGRDLAPSVRVDAQGCAFVDGNTDSSDFPLTTGSYQITLRGRMDAYVVKFTPDGSDLVYGTLLGGSQNDGAAGKHGLAIDAAGNAYVVGYTDSQDFPMTPGAFQGTHAGGFSGSWEQTGDRFIAKISPDGSRLVACTFLGGDARDGGEGIAVDGQGRVYLSAFTYSTDFPVTTDAFQTSSAGDRDAAPFVLSADFARAEFSSYMGGTLEDNFRAVALGPDGSFVIVGSTQSQNWPVHNAFQPTFGGGNNDALVVKFSPVRDPSAVKRPGLWMDGVSATAKSTPHFH